MALDPIDQRLLAELQRDSTQTAEALGAKLGLSGSQIARRRQRLEVEGFVTGYGARVNPERLGLGVQAFISVQMASQDPKAARALHALVTSTPEVISAWTLTGEADYLLRVWCQDLKALNHLIHQLLLPHPAVARVQSQIVMDQFKPDAPLPT